MGENANEGFRVENDGIELEYSEKEPYLTSIRIVDSVKYTISEICTNSDEYWDYDDYSTKQLIKKERGGKYEHKSDNRDISEFFK